MRGRSGVGRAGLSKEVSHEEDWSDEEQLAETHREKERVPSSKHSMCKGPEEGCPLKIPPLTAGEAGLWG